MIKFLSRNLLPMTTEEWAKAFEDNSIRVVDRTTIGEWTVSTIWEGFDIGGNDRIFETAMLDQDGDVTGRYRSSSEEEARQMHQILVSELTNGTH